MRSIENFEIKLIRSQTIVFRKISQLNKYTYCLIGYQIMIIVMALAFAKIRNSISCEYIEA